MFSDNTTLIMLQVMFLGNYLLRQMVFIAGENSSNGVCGLEGWVMVNYVPDSYRESDEFFRMYVPDIG